MTDTAERVARVKRRAREQSRQRERWRLSALGGLCAALLLALVGGGVSMGGGGLGAVQGMYGATMMLPGAGGYVLVGIVTFIAAVVITVLCIRHREKNEKEARKKGENEREENKKETENRR